MRNMHLDIGKSKKIVFFVGFSLFLLFLFGLKDILILASKEWPHLYPVVDVPRATWEEVCAYLPFATHFSLSNLLPAAPMADPTLSKFTFFPPITIIVQGMIFKWVCVSNIDLYFLLMHTMFPLFSFWLIFLVFNRYIAVSWSLLFAFLGVNNFPNFSFFGYVLGVISDPAGFIASASLSPMEITRAPIPGFSLFCFLGTFYVSTKTPKLSRSHYLGFSALWALNLYVYLFNFVAGILFWFPYIVYTHWLKKTAFDFRKVAKALGENFLVVMAVISPVLVKSFVFFSRLDKEVFQRMELVTYKAGFIINDWGLIFSHILPIVAVVFVIWIYCGDYYELAHRFTLVFILIGVAVLGSNLHIILGRFFQPNLFSMRIGDFFLRYFYYVPIIYFLSQPYKRLFHGEFTNALSRLTHSLFMRFVVKRRILIAFVGILMASLFSVFSTVRYNEHYQKSAAPRMQMVAMEFDDLISVVESESGTVASEDIPVNLLIPVLTKRETLLVNGFCNYVPYVEILDRIILFTKIFEWDEKRFLDFMMPSERIMKCNVENSFVFSDEVLRKGFGYLLLNHRKIMAGNELKEYYQGVLRAFRDFDLMENTKRYRVKAVQAKGSIAASLPIKSVKKKGQSNLYLLKDM